MKITDDPVVRSLAHDIGDRLEDAPSSTSQAGSVARLLYEWSASRPDWASLDAKELCLRSEAMLERGRSLYRDDTLMDTLLIVTGLLSAAVQRVDRSKAAIAPSDTARSLAR